MRFSPTPPHAYGGIDRHARSLYVCILHQAGAIMLHPQMHTSPKTCLKAMAPDREALVGAVDGLLTWSWRADRCAQEQLPGGLGHARSMHALHGGHAHNAPIDAQPMAGFLRGGMLPHAAVYPAARRATRDLLRRRLPLPRTRAERLAHSHPTHSPYHRPALGTQLASKAHREGGGAVLCSRRADACRRRSRPDWRR